MPRLDPRKTSALSRVAPHDLDLDRAAMKGHPLHILQVEGQPPVPRRRLPRRGRSGQCGPIAEPLHGMDDDFLGKQPAVRHHPAAHRIASEVPAHHAGSLKLQKQLGRGSAVLTLEIDARREDRSLGVHSSSVSSSLQKSAKRAYASGGPRRRILSAKSMIKHSSVPPNLMPRSPRPMICS